MRKNRNYHLRQPTEDRIKIVELYFTEGITLQEIADKYDISKQRVHQIAERLIAYAFMGRYKPEMNKRLRSLVPKETRDEN